ncbi:MAG TPA: ABC transporter substrate-binding protein [Baekduia sp.]|jgi:peptide/nickel transport system substrate-binding protein
MKRVHLTGAAAMAVVALAAAGCGKAAPGDATGANGAAKPAAAPSATLSPTTPAATSDVPKATWALYREVGTLDPIQAFDYPENTVVTALCDSLTRQNPDGTLSPGLAEKSEHPDDTTLVLTVRQGVKFWDGKPLTAADVVYSLKRAADPKAGGFYPSVFSRVKSITATGADEVTVKLKQPDYWLDGELSQMAGVVYEKAFAESKGRKFGTPEGGLMCTGPYKVGGWKAGSELSVVRNDNYWDPATKAKVGEIDFKGVPDESSITTGFVTGAIDGSYPQALGTIDQLRSNPKLTVTDGPSFASDAIVVSSLKGALGDVRVRQALSMAIDRKAYIDTLYHGDAQLPRTLANPGTWGYAKDVFQADWDKLPDPTVDVAKGKQLVTDAGATGKTITLGMTSEVSTINSSATAIRSAGESIGLKVKFKAVSAQNFINFFTDPKAREGVDAFPTVNYPDYADPAAFYTTVAAPDGSQNYDGFTDPQINQALDAARTTADPAARAKLVVQAGDRIADQLPWIPMAAPSSVLITRKGLTGAPSSFVYMGGPWANLLGGA